MLHLHEGRKIPDAGLTSEDQLVQISSDQIRRRSATEQSPSVVDMVADLQGHSAEEPCDPLLRPMGKNQFLPILDTPSFGVNHHTDSPIEFGLDQDCQLACLTKHNSSMSREDAHFVPPPRGVQKEQFPVVDFTTGPRGDVGGIAPRSFSRHPMMTRARASKPEARGERFEQWRPKVKMMRNH